MSKPIAEKGEVCPFNGKGVEKVCHKCPMYIQLRGRHPQTGQEIDQWGCSFAFTPILLIENAQQMHQTGAAVESFRNEVVKDNQAISNALQIASAARMRDPKLIEGK
jgi:hypothetical protein